MNAEIKPQSLKNNVLIQELNDEVLLYDLNRDKVFALNETSAIVWNLCDGNNSIEAIREKLEENLNQQVSVELIWLALSQLKKEELLTNLEECKIDFNGLSRREVIKKVGLGSMVAFPIIISLISPTASTAASATACGADLNIVCQCAADSISDCNLVNFGAPAINQFSCKSSCNPASANCLCSGKFICSGIGQKQGMCLSV